MEPQRREFRGVDDNLKRKKLREKFDIRSPKDAIHFCNDVIMDLRQKNWKGIASRAHACINLIPFAFGRENQELLELAVDKVKRAMEDVNFNPNHAQERAEANMSSVERERLQRERMIQDARHEAEAGAFTNNMHRPYKNSQTTPKRPFVLDDTYEGPTETRCLEYMDMVKRDGNYIESIMEVLVDDRYEHVWKTNARRLAEEISKYLRILNLVDAKVLRDPKDKKKYDELVEFGKAYQEFLQAIRKQLHLDEARYICKRILRECMEYRCRNIINETLYRLKQIL